MIIRQHKNQEVEDNEDLKERMISLTLTRLQEGSLSLDDYSSYKNKRLCHWISEATKRIQEERSSALKTENKQRWILFGTMIFMTIVLMINFLLNILHDYGFLTTIAKWY